MQFQQPNQKSENQKEEIDIIELLFFYVTKWRYFVVVIAASLLLAFLYLKIAAPKYQVTGAILLRSDDKSDLASKLSQLGDFGLSLGKKQADDEIYVIKSERLIGKMIGQLGLQKQYYLKQGFKYQEQYPVSPISVSIPQSLQDSLLGTIEMYITRNNNVYKVNAVYNKDNKEDFSCIIHKIDGTYVTPWGNFTFHQNRSFKNGEKLKINIIPLPNQIESYEKLLSVTLARKESNVIDLSLVVANKQKGRDIINTMISLYNADALNDKSLMAARTAEFVEERLNKISVELSEVESQIEEYKMAHNIADIPDQTKIILASSNEYRKQLTTLEIQLNGVKWVEQQLKTPVDQYALIPSDLGIQDKGLVDIIGDYDVLLLQRLRLLQSTNERNPVLQQLETKIKMVQKNILSSVINIHSTLVIAKNSLIKKNEACLAQIDQIPVIERQYTEIKRQQEIKQNLYLFLLQKREENALSLAAAVTSTKIVDPAFVSPFPIFPKKKVILIVAFLLAIFLTIAYLYIYEIMHNKISSRKEIEKMTSLPILGEIGIFRGEERILIQEGDNSNFSEMFRMIRSNLSFLLAAKQGKRVLVTSSVSNEGKSVVAINLALAMAMLGKKTIIVGMDIRVPRLAEYTHMDVKAGVTDFLANSSASLEKLIFPSSLHPYLSILQSGVVPPNPTELLLTSRVEELFEQLDALFDYIIIDSAPVGLVADTLALNRIADAVVYVCRQDVTPKHSVQHLQNLVQEKHLSNVGVILNGVDMKSGYYRYGYGVVGYADKKKR
ncbi:GumC family protein [Microbacter margulisiae]|uniref:non-specific protein-tyrosine kinase n=1 Tax=Microbacter margulisiae TaxID=1350067 RepID=A0A7W5DR36_9PORP|nr:polysaccharide biosynthesis tyrosine autokinase [Microbacter margulisiae]MBB3187542.1 capsular exopolysaccharide synthesis family protein [Microbacter margulisiae]